VGPCPPCLPDLCPFCVSLFFFFCFFFLGVFFPLPPSLLLPVSSSKWHFALSRLPADLPVVMPLLVFVACRNRTVFIPVPDRLMD
jgi:hypothetical protein